MADTPALAHPEIQAQLIAEALGHASVGFLVWDEDRRYIAANDAACKLLGTTLDALLGQQVGGHTADGDDPLERALASGFATGRATVERFDGSGSVEMFYVTFTTRSAGLPFMATVIHPA
jgi:PAS domain-containing protein